MNPDWSPKMVGFFIFMGLALGFWVFELLRHIREAMKRWSLKRFIENIPTSKIATAPMGSWVEIKGRIVMPPDQPLRAPFSNTPCAFYLLKQGKFGVWCPQNYLIIEDGSGAFAIVPLISLMYQSNSVFDSFIHLAPDYEQTKRTTLNYFSKKSPKIYNELLNAFQSELQTQMFAPNLSEMPPNSEFRLKIMEKAKSLKKRFTEHVFKQGAPVYVMGHAEPASHLFSILDSNRDGKLSDGEVKGRRKLIEQELGKGDSVGHLKEILPKTKLILRGTKENWLILGSSEEEAKGRFLKRAWGFIISGAIVFPLFLGLWVLTIKLFIWLDHR